MASGFSSTQRAKGEPGMSGKVTSNLAMSLLLSILQPTAKEATPHFSAPFWTSLVIASNTWREKKYDNDAPVDGGDGDGDEV